MLSIHKLTVKCFTGFSFILVLTIIILSAGCRKEEINTDPSFRLEFSHDTILFDTIFTTIGTTTRSLIVHNRGNQKVILESVSLARGQSSPFRINIDGESAFEARNIEIGAKDSLFIFVKVTIDPNNSNSPLIQTDSILFRVNGYEQNVKLVAWGQDAVFYSNDTLRGNVTLSSVKPYVIYGSLVIDSLSQLDIAPGTNLYFHQNSGLLIRNGASIRVNGTLEEPVTFRGDRLDKDYTDVPGQWLGIEIEGESSGNTFNWARILNGRYGIIADSAGNADQPRITLYNTIVHNMVNYGVLSTHNNLLALNCQISNCGAYAVAIEGGGKCEFRHCTLANFQSLANVHYPALYLSNYISYDDGKTSKFPLEGAYFGNCIISGSSYNEEIEQDSISGIAFNFTFDHCLAQTGLYSSHQSAFPGSIINEDPKFKDAIGGNFELDTLSRCKDAGLMSIITQSPADISRDLKGESRTQDSGPDLGSYERIEGK